MTVQRHDRWSLWLLALALLAVILLWWCIVSNALLLTILVLLAAALIFGWALIALLVYLATRRVRATLSALAAVAILAGGFAVRLLVLNVVRYADFAFHRAGYERTVEAWRAKNPGAVPFRLILDGADRSALVVPTIFDYIVYDESDAIGRDPPVLSGHWLCAVPGGNDTMMATGGGNIVVKQLGGHFYFVEQTL